MIFVKFDRNSSEWTEINVFLWNLTEICQNGPKLMIFFEIKMSCQYFAGMLINFRLDKFWHSLLGPISRKVMLNFFVKNDIYMVLIITPSVPECSAYSFLAWILRHVNFIHGAIISHGENRREMLLTATN